MTSESSNSRAACATWSTARLNASSFAFEGFVNPLSLRTNCNDDARISSSVAGGLKLWSVLIFRHMLFCCHPDLKRCVHCHLRTRTMLSCSPSETHPRERGLSKPAQHRSQRYQEHRARMQRQPQPLTKGPQRSSVPGCPDPYRV